MPVLTWAFPACPEHCLSQTFTSSDTFAVEQAVDSLCLEFRAVDDLVARNIGRVLRAYQNARVGFHHFGGSTGYGHEEAGGCEALDQAFAEIFGSEYSLFTVTHAITCALFGFFKARR
ncbi:hypothetical protein NMG60_11037121 [Bertholletia excelsa]